LEPNAAPVIAAEAVQLPPVAEPEPEGQAPGFRAIPES
jgi:hypothetical protein